MRSDGLLTLAPRSRELFDTSSAYLWALAQDSKGNLYTGGGTGAKLYRIPPDGKGKMLADLDALEIHAIAVDSKDRVYCGHLARRQGLSHHRQRQAGSLLRSQGEVHLGAGVRQQGRPVRGHRRSRAKSTA